MLLKQRAMDADDAKRYRWLREQESLCIEGKGSDWSGGYFPNELDAWIDKQRRDGNNGGAK
jgi:hypothetical protein